MDGEGVVRGRTGGLVEPNFSWGYPFRRTSRNRSTIEPRIMGRVVWWAHTDLG